MHLAAATGIPTLGLFGPSRPSEYAPTGPLSTWVAAKGIEGETTMTDISVEYVAEAALTLLRKAKRYPTDNF